MQHPEIKEETCISEQLGPMTTEYSRQYSTSEYYYHHPRDYVNNSDNVNDKDIETRWVEMFNLWIIVGTMPITSVN